MQIASVYNAAGAAPQAQALVGVPDINRVLAVAHVRILDRDDNVTFTTHLQLVSGGQLGATEGYSTLRKALFELGVLTQGERVGAAAVIERDGRFFGRVLKGRDLEQGVRAPLRRTFLEEDKRASVVAMRTNDRLDRLRALVDGGWSRSFRST